MTPGTKLEGRRIRAAWSGGAKVCIQPAAGLRRAALSDLDGPLSHLLAKRAEAEAELQKARLNVEHFIIASDIIIAKANGHPVSPELIPEPVAHWVNLIHRRAAEKSGRILHAAE